MPIAFLTPCVFAREQRMKVCHAAAFALVGWYLMLPPALPHDPDKVDESAPLSQWDLMQKFDSESQCAAERTRMIGLGNHLGRVAQCVASDDRRLKEKAPAN
ncbi:MAG: hypothetical protein ACREQH_10010 [Candidatus Binatus sp.]